ncbi:hypothetical protein GJAV_G00063840 [Gymnothorax javanicus]|nr:hypothetical protein GJAV_G00063840 [Gymnothorax javanicus]
MAEARHEEEEEPREFREVAVLRNRRQSNPATDRSERNKPDRRLSQGPLSSIRAAIKRTTSTRSSSQAEHTRDRRRPEITIVSAEPLVGNNWFPGASGGFQTAPPPAQPIWGGSIPAAPQPPPSYDQVIREKTQEQITPPAATPRHSTTIATQTDFLFDADPKCTDAPLPVERTRSAGKIPLKPPRLSVPKPKPEPDDSAVVADPPCLIQEEPPSVWAVTSSAANQQASETFLDLGCLTRSDPSPPLLCDETAEPFERSCESVASQPQPAEVNFTDPAASQTQQPIPLPRSKRNLQPISREVKVQTLVRIKDDGDSSQIAVYQRVPPSGKYLQELLDIFSTDDQCYQCNIFNQADCSDYTDPSKDTDPYDQTDHSDQSDYSDHTDSSDNEDLSKEDDTMSISRSSRSIKAKIHAFEKQAAVDAEDESPVVKPEPRPRSKPPAVAAKPQQPFARRALSLQEQPNASESSDERIQKEPLVPPTPAPRPLLPSSSSEVEIGDVPATAVGKVPLRPSMENGSVDRPAAQVMIKPQRPSNFGPNPPGVSRKPTMIRVPSKVDEPESQEAPPPLPVQKPFGGVPLPIIQKPTISRPTYPPPAVETSNPEMYSAPKQEFLLPPRPVTSKVLPPRPAPPKSAPSRPPPPGAQGLPGASFQAGQAATLPTRLQSSRSVVKRGPIQPPRPHPGHPLYNKYTLGIPHAIAEFDHNGMNSGELSFQKNEVLVLLAQTDSNTFECQVGDAKGPVQKSYMKIITPLYSAPGVQAPQVRPPPEARRGSSGLQAQALHDFIPEGPDELALKAGDLVSMVEAVDNEWYRGTARGNTGIFPISFVRMLSSIPAPPVGQKATPAPATISGPRCVARFEFEGGSSDELSFHEGDVIKLKEYIGQDWAQGELNGNVGIFPLNFVEIVEDLPPPPQQNMQTKIPLPGMVSAAKNYESAKLSQPSSARAEWVRAQYDFIAEADEELSFQQGAVILITEHVDAVWYRGRLDGKEGLFPVAFVEPSPAPLEGRASPRSGGGARARALFDFEAESEDELSVKAGDIISGLETLDDEWFAGELNGMRGAVPKNYVQVLQEP